MAAPVMIVCYDISSDRARRRISDLCAKQLVRVQESVFEGRIDEQASRRLARKIAQHILPGDSVRIYCLTPEGIAKSSALGGQPLPEQQDFFLY